MKPPILSAAEIDYPPFSIVDGQGRAGGFSVELLQAALAAMGRDVTFRTGPWDKVKGWLEKGEVQVLPLVGRTPEREKFFEFTVPYMSLNGAIVVRRQTRDIQNLEDLRGRSVAVMKGDNAEEFLRREERGIKLHAMATFDDALRELSRGRHDAVVIQRLVALRLLQETGLTDLRIINQPIEEFRQDFCFAVREGDRETLALLNEGLSLVMADGTYRHLHAKWFAALELPAGRRIVIGGDHNYPPYEYLDENGRPTGYNVELTRAIAREVGLDVEIRLGPWADIRNALARDDIDALQGMFYSPERDLTFDFSPPHAVNQCVSVVRSGEGEPPETIAELAGKRVVVQKGDIMHDFALKNGLGNQIAVVDAQEGALRELAEGKHDCALVSRLTARYWIEKQGWDNLTVGRRPFVSLEYCYAVPNGHKALMASFSEGLKILDQTGEFRRIQDKWLGVYEDSPPGFVAILRYAAVVLLPLLLILLAVSLWSWSLRRQVAARTLELQKSERLLRIAGQLARLGGWSVNLADSRVHWTDEVAVIHGMPPGFSPTLEEGIGYYAPEFREKIKERFTACTRDGTPYDEEMQIITGEGNRVWVRTIGMAERNNAGAIISAQGGFQDISERKQAEETLRAERDRAQTYLDITSVMFVALDRDGTVTLINKKGCAILGRGEADILGKNWFDHFIPKSTSADIKQVFRKLMADGLELSGLLHESPIITAGGEERLISWHNTILRDPEGNITGSLSSGEDISERKQMEKALKESEAQYRLLVENANGIILVAQDGLIRFINHNVFDFLGYTPEEVTGKPFIDYVHPEDRKTVAERYLKRLKDEALPGVYPFRIVDRTGTAKWVEINAVRIEWKEKPATLNFLADISERKHAEAEREKLSAQLLQAQKMESVGRLAGGVAHDFNNMLNVILGYTELALEKTAPDDPLRDDLTEIFDAGRRSSEITRQLLAFARKQAIAPRTLDLNETVEGLLKMLRRLIGEDIDLAWQPGAGLWPIYLDPAQIDQLLANLLVNARDAISGVGKVTIETDNVRLDEAYCAGHAESIPGEYVLLAVSDDGCGMEKNVLDNLFEPFFTTKEVGEGTGLGLATVYGIVRQNHGLVDVYSEPGQGSTFRIYLPRHAGQANEIAAPDTAEFPEGNGETVLVVEDEASILRLARKMLTVLGYKVLTAPTPTSALKLAGEQGREIRLLMTDVVMPEMNGRDLAERLQVLYPGLKVLFMSGYTADVIAHRGILETGVHFIQKPFNKNDLAKKVREALLE